MDVDNLAHRKLNKEMIKKRRDNFIYDKGKEKPLDIFILILMNI